MGGVKLNRKLVLEEAQRLPDGAGGFNQSWQSLGTVWADIRARSGRDVAGETVSLSATSYRIIVRAAPMGAPSRPVAGQRLREDARVFRIEAVAEMDRDLRYLVCFCAEEVAV